MRGPKRMAPYALALAFAVLAAGSATAAPRPPPAVVAQMAIWAVDSGDSGGRPFGIVDKKSARVFVFDADGKLAGATPALLGLARGDESVPGIGDRDLYAIKPAERTTPAGRFVAGFSSPHGGPREFWIDYATAISLHPVIVGEPKDHRLQRLKTPTPKDNRITFGCINVPRAFYDGVIRKTFAKTNGVFYILPETKPLDEVFPSFGIQMASSAGGSEPTR